jgi:HD-GYP domain-containing protein (c-di-GMP phosphodiesterase class II)
MSGNEDVTGATMTDEEEIRALEEADTKRFEAGEVLGDTDEAGTPGAAESIPTDDGKAAFSPDTLAAIAGTTEGTPPKHVPYDRFSEKVALAKSLEENLVHEKAEKERLAAELAALKGDGKVEGEKKEPEKTLRELKAEYRKVLKDSVFDPDDEDAAKLLVELEEKIEEEEIRVVESRVTKKLETESAQTTAKTNLQQVVASAYEAYPFLNPESPDVNAELNNNIVNYRVGLEAQGVPRHEALQRAVDTFAPAYAEKHGLLKGGGEPDDIARKRAELEKQAREKAALASRTQPPVIAGAGHGARADELKSLDVTKLSEKEFDSLPETEVKKLMES